jgi:hypothetical protein
MLFCAVHGLAGAVNATKLFQPCNIIINIIIFVAVVITINNNNNIIIIIIIISSSSSSIIKLFIAIIKCTLIKLLLYCHIYVLMLQGSRWWTTQPRRTSPPVYSDSRLTTPIPLCTRRPLTASVSCRTHTLSHFLH